MTEGELTTRVETELKALSSEFVAGDYTNAIDSAKKETGFTLPNTNNTQTLWLIQRTKRHLLFALYIQNALKFKLKQLSLDQKFDHLGVLIKTMDSEYKDAWNSMDFIMAGVSSEKLFGSKIDAGFIYDQVTGEDLTYSDDTLPTITPTDEDV